MARNVTGAAALPNIPTSWSVAGQRDFNGDTSSDILWRDSSGNDRDLADERLGDRILDRVAAFRPPGRSPAPATLTATARATSCGATTSGNVAIWLMNGASIASVAVVGNIPTTWSVAAPATSM